MFKLTLLWTQQRLCGQITHLITSVGAERSEIDIGILIAPLL